MSTYFGGKTMFKKRDRNQLNLLESNRRFIVEINPENRWVKLSEKMPWDRIEDHYAQNMCEDWTNGDIVTNSIWINIRERTREIN